MTKTPKPSKTPTDKDGAPTGLPEPRLAAVENRTSAVDKARFCKTCGKEARIISGPGGVQAICNTCKTDWPIANTIARGQVGMSIARGLQKMTYVEPDFSKLYDD